MLFDNKSFYPTPSGLAIRMACKIKGNPRKILEPSAGKGDLIEAVTSRYGRHGTPEVCAIEIDPVLQATLRGKSVNLIDTDFLAYSGPDKWDLIIANPPFEDGEQHLTKALDIMYRGQIIFLLNAETLRNPHTNARKALVRRLEEVGAKIEYIRDAFLDAERRTGVEVALVDIMIERKVEDDLFVGVDDVARDSADVFTEKYEVSTGRSVDELVAEYNRVVDVGTQTIADFYRNYRLVGSYLKLNDVGGKDSQYASSTLTEKLQGAVNALLRSVRTSFWRRTLDLKEVSSRLTESKRAEFEHALTSHCSMDFTASNLRQFVLNLIGGYEQTLTEAVLETFDKFTVKHCWDDGIHQKNVHYFNGWKTNSSFKVGRRVVVPIRGSYGGPFRSYNKWDLDYQAARVLDDFDKVMNYFDGMKEYVSMSTAIKEAFARGESSGIESTYFRATCHIKGTIHLTFLDDDILRRFNVVACRGKGWLPGDFGAKAYRQLSAPERAVVDSFEGEKSYDRNINVALFGRAAVPQIAFLEAA